MTQRVSLYVTGGTPLSISAIENLKNIFKKAGASYDLKIVDVLKHPEIVEEKNILATPLLEKTYPIPTKIIGDLSDVENVLVKLDLIEMMV